MKLAAAMASSHAFALMPPSEWDTFRLRNRQAYGRRFGDLPPEQNQITLESLETVGERYRRISDGHRALQGAIARLRPEVIVIFADDQNENLTAANLPQVAIYTGGDFRTGRRGGGETRGRRAHPQLAAAILNACVESDIDMASLATFTDELLFAHAVGPMLDTIDPEGTSAVLPIFLNAIHVPAPSPARCFYVGQVVRRAIDSFVSAGSAVACASGGWSHFSAGYPWESYTGPYGYGAIAETFDRQVLQMMADGDVRRLAALTSQDLLDNGDIELRTWITALGVLGDHVRPELLVYEPFYRGIMGMGVAYWPLAA